MGQKFKLLNGEGYFEIVDVAEITSDKKWKTVVLFTSSNTTVYSDAKIITDEDAISAVKALCDKLNLSVG